MTEGALLSIAGSALALWLARSGLRTLTQAYPAALPRSTEVSIDLPVLLFACGIATPAVKNNTRVANSTVPSVGPFHIVDYYQWVMPDYFETMGIPIVRGRGFQRTDATSSGLVAIVNEKFEETFWKGRDPIGQRVKPCCNDQPPWFTVVGVANDVKQGRVDRDTGAELYMATEQVARPAPGLGIAPINHLVLRSSLAPAALSQTIERVVHDMDRAVPVVRIRDMEAVFAESIQRPRFLAQPSWAVCGTGTAAGRGRHVWSDRLHRCQSAP